MQQAFLIALALTLAGLSSLSALGFALQTDVQGNAQAQTVDPVPADRSRSIALTSTTHAASLGAAWRAARNAFRTTLDSTEVRAGKVYGRPAVPQVVIDQVETLFSATQASSSRLDAWELARAKEISIATLVAAPEGINLPRAFVRTSGIRGQKHLRVEVPQPLIAAIQRGDYDGELAGRVSEALAPSVALALRQIHVDPIDINQVVHAAMATAIGYGARPVFPELHVVEQNALLASVQNPNVLRKIRRATEQHPHGMTDASMIGVPAEQAFFARHTGDASRYGDTETWKFGFVRHDDGAITIPDGILLEYVLGGASDFEQGPRYTRRFGQLKR